MALYNDLNSSNFNNQHLFHPTQNQNDEFQRQSSNIQLNNASNQVLLKTLTSDNLEGSSLLTDKNATFNQL